MAAKTPIVQKSKPKQLPSQTEKDFTPTKVPISLGKVTPREKPILLNMSSLSVENEAVEYINPSKALYQGDKMPESEASRVWFLLGKSAAALQEHIPQFEIVVLDASDPSVRLFAANGLLRQSETEFTHKTHGLASFYLKGSKINGEKTEACYVVYNSNLGGHLWRNFISPFKTYIAGTDFLMAHEVAHCIDAWEKVKKLQDGNLTLAEASLFGVEEHAWQRIVKKDTVSKSDYFKNLLELAKDNAYQQYQERVADAFAVLWLKARASVASIKEATDVVNKTRGVQSAWASHNTSAVFKDLAYPENPQKIDDLWSAARLAQQKTSVDPSTISGPHAGFKDPADKKEDSDKSKIQKEEPAVKEPAVKEPAQTNSSVEDKTVSDKKETKTKSLLVTQVEADKQAELTSNLKVEEAKKEPAKKDINSSSK